MEAQGDGQHDHGAGPRENGQALRRVESHHRQYECGRRASRERADAIGPDVHQRLGRPLL